MDAGAIDARRDDLRPRQILRETSAHGGRVERREGAVETVATERRDLGCKDAAFYFANRAKAWINDDPWRGALTRPIDARPAFVCPTWLGPIRYSRKGRAVFAQTSWSQALTGRAWTTTGEAFAKQCVGLPAANTKSATIANFGYIVLSLLKHSRSRHQRINQQ